RRQITCGLMMVFTSRPYFLARCLILALCAGKAAQAFTGSAPAGLVMKIKSECLAAYSSPALDDAALTRNGLLRPGLGARKAFSVFQKLPLKVSSSSSVQS